MILRARGFATGIAAAANYFMAFIATKTYYNFESALSMPGVTMLYCIIGIFGYKEILSNDKQKKKK